MPPRVLKCIRCEHQWIPQVTHLPKQCPSCKSPYWNKDYVRSDKVLKIMSLKDVLS